MRLKDKIAVVTASTRGIGAAIAETFAREGAKVYLAARSAERAKIMIDRLTKEGCFVSFVYNDALKQETYKSMIEEIVEKEGRLDILVNNFGTSNADKDLDIQSTEYAENPGFKYWKCLSRLAGSDSAYGEKRRWKHHQYLFCRRFCSGYFPDRIWYQQGRYQLSYEINCHADSPGQYPL